jgi:hypothetical protein
MVLPSEPLPRNVAGATGKTSPPIHRNTETPKHRNTTYRGYAGRKTTTGSALVGDFGIPAFRSQPLGSPLGCHPGMRMAPGKKRLAAEGSLCEVPCKPFAARIHTIAHFEQPFPQRELLSSQRLSRLCGFIGPALWLRLQCKSTGSRILGNGSLSVGSCVLRLQ